MAGSIAQTILDIESQNDGVIYLFRSGAFWNVYDFSAYVLMFEMETPLKTRFAKFKVSAKMHQGILSHVVIGFPDKTMQELVNGLNANMYEVETLSDTIKKISSKRHKFKKEQDYADWLNNKIFREHKEMENVAKNIKNHKRKMVMLSDKTLEETELPQFCERDMICQQ